jgi:hypothetical protein
MRSLVTNSIAWSAAVLGLAVMAHAQFDQPGSSQPQQSSPPASGAAQLPGQSPQQQQPAANAVAMVNGDAITQPEFRSALEAQMKQVDQNDPHAQQKVRQQVLSSLIESRLVEQYMISKGPDVPKQEVEATIGQYKQQLQGQGVSFDEFLQARGYTEDSLTRRVQGSLAWQKHQQQQMTEDKLKEHFEENQSRFPVEDFEAAKPLVAQSFVSEMWTDIVAEVRSDADIRIVEQPAPGGTPPAPQ